MLKIMFLFSTDVPYTNANSPGLAPTGLPMWQAEADIADNVCFACHSSGPIDFSHGELKRYELYGNLKVYRCSYSVVRTFIAQKKLLQFLHQNVY